MHDEALDFHDSIVCEWIHLILLPLEDIKVQPLLQRKDRRVFSGNHRTSCGSQKARSNNKNSSSTVEWDNVETLNGYTPWLVTEEPSAIRRQSQTQS